MYVGGRMEAETNLTSWDYYPDILILDMGHDRIILTQ